MENPHYKEDIRIHPFGANSSKAFTDKARTGTLY